MDLKKLFTEERAVSPVIGVILMVAITVILAAVIGAFVLGIGGDQNATPSASISLDPDVDDTVTVEHNGGQTLDLEEIQLSVDGTIVTQDDGDGDRLSDYTDSDTLRAGETVTVESGTGNSDISVAADNQIRLIHEPSGGILASTTA